MRIDPPPTGRRAPAGAASPSLPLFALAALLAAGCGVAPDRGDGPVHQRPPDSKLDPSGYAELAPHHVDTVFAEQSAGFDNCNRELPGAFVSGVARLMFLLDPRGRVEQVFVIESDVGSLKVEQCLVTAGRFMEFPVPPSGKRSRFVRSFAINPAAEDMARPMAESWGYAAIRGRRDAIRDCRARYGYDGPFHLTTYVGGRGQALSAGFHARQQTPDDFAHCVVRVVEETTFPDTGGAVVEHRILVEFLPDD